MNVAYLILGALAGMLASLLALATGTSFPECLILYPAVGVPSALMFAAAQVLSDRDRTPRISHRGRSTELSKSPQGF